MWALTLYSIVTSYTIADRAARDACPFWNAMGMLLDAGEIFCESADAVQERWEPLATESVAFVCCPKPYKPCSVAERVPKCDDVVAPYLAVDPSSLDQNSAMERLQQARGALMKADPACASFSTEEPHTGCGVEKRSATDNQPRAFERADLFCEMMLWQSEQLGDGNEAEFKANECPYNGVVADDSSRKSKRLQMDALPAWAKTHATAELLEKRATLADQDDDEA